jgi:hypothetical protein
MTVASKRTASKAIHNSPAPIWTESSDEFIRRIFWYSELLGDRSGFQATEIYVALLDNKREETADQIAAWLRDELKRSNDALVSNGEFLPPVVIADMAMTLLEAKDHAPGPNLIFLLRELLAIDRHRKAVSEKPSEAFMCAVQIEAQLAADGAKSIGVRKLAKMVGVSPPTVSGWRKSAEYSQTVACATKLLFECRRNGVPENRDLFRFWFSLSPRDRAMPLYSLLTVAFLRRCEEISNREEPYG